MFDNREQALSPALAFLTPSRARSGGVVSAGGERLEFRGECGRLVAHAWGSGPAVLLVHGWEGSRDDLMPFVAPIVACGLRAILLDLPAHGESEGSRTSIPAAARDLLALQRQLGHELHGVLAHSVGSAVVVQALAQGLPAGRVVLISAPESYSDYALKAAAAMGLDSAETERMLADLLALGVDVRAMSTQKSAAMLSQPALFVHSLDDRVVPVGDGRAGASAWPGARLLEFNGLGHKAILRSSEVINASVDFLATKKLSLSLPETSAE